MQRRRTLRFIGMDAMLVAMAIVGIGVLVYGAIANVLS
jgi:hypothetical protein